MSESRLKKVSANFQISTDTDLYRNIIEPKSSARCLSEFVHDLLDIYNSCSDIRALIDAKIDEKNPLNQIKEQVSRVNSEHQKMLMSAHVLSGFIDFNSSDFNTSNVDMASDVVNSAEIFESDGVLENLKMLLPTSVQEEIKDNIEKRVRTLESKVESIINSIATKGNVSQISNVGVSKVSRLVNDLENMYDLSDSGVISEEVAIPTRKEVLNNPLDTISISVDVEPTNIAPTIVNEPIKVDTPSVSVESESLNDKPPTPNKPKSFNKLLGGLK